MAKQRADGAQAEGAGMAPGVRIPIIPAARAGGDHARLASSALAARHKARLSGLAVEMATGAAAE